MAEIAEPVGDRGSGNRSGRLRSGALALSISFSLVGGSNAFATGGSNIVDVAAGCWMDAATGC